MITVQSLTEYIEGRFPAGPSTSGSLSVTGEPYVVIGAQHPGTPAIPGTVDEGCSRELAFDEETACLQARSCFDLYAEGRTGALYWRVRPQLEMSGNRCVVYMRLLISDAELKLKGTK